MNIDVYNTHIEVYPYAQNDYPVIEDMYTATDKFTGGLFACGYTINDGKLYLPRGTSLSKLHAVMGVQPKIILDSDPSEEMDRQHHAIYEPRNSVQEESIKFLQGPEHQLALNLKTGVGKGLPLSTRIPTPEGFKLMKDIKVGDKVFGSDGRPVNVIGVYPQGVRDVYRITFSDGRTVDCDENHLWAVTHPWSPNKVQVLRTIDLLKDYKVYREHMQKSSLNKDPYEYRYHVQLMSEPAQFAHRAVPIEPYVIGAMIGNGCCTEPVLTISCGDDFVPNKIAELIDAVAVKSKGGNYSYVFKRLGDDGQYHPIRTAEFFKFVPDMIGKYSREKKIPEMYLYNDTWTRLELLRGLMDTDGSICTDMKRFNVSYCSCSRTLLEQIRWIVLSLGFISNISSADKRTEKYVDGYHASVSIRVPHWYKPNLFTHPRKLWIAQMASKMPDAVQKFKYLKIKNIEYVRRDRTKCIKVDAPDHLYLTDEFIVTHNTFCVAYAVTLLRRRVLIITPNEGLKQQWIQTFTKMFDYRPSQIINIAGGAVMDAIMEDNVKEADVYVVNHSTLRNYLMDAGPYQFHKFFKKLKIGIKVYDESHLEFGNILMIDFFSNTERTWYLTATFDRSDKTESMCFKRAFQSVIPYGERESAEITRKHVLYHEVNINSRISPKNRAMLMAHPGFTSAKYGRYAFFLDPNDTTYKTILEILKKTEKMEGKTLIFVPLIDAVEEVVKKIKRDFPEKSCAAYHSKISKDEKASAEKKDIIVSTIKSCGTGRDIKGLRAVICAEPVASKLVTEQMIGRLRPYAPDKDTYYFDIVDRSIPPITWWYRARLKKVETLVKQKINLAL